MDRALRLRPVTAADRPALRALLDRCSDRSIFLRFFALDRDVAVHYVDELTGSWPPGRYTLVAELGTALVGLATYDRTGSARADVAVLVDDAHHHQGIGRRLLEGLAAHARRHGIQEFVAVVLSENAPMLRLLHGLPYTVVISINGPEREARWSLWSTRPAGPQSQTADPTDEGPCPLPSGYPPGEAGPMTARTDPLHTVDGPPPASRRIVVGIDDDGTNTAALLWAAHEARSRGATLRLERGYTWAMAEGHMTSDDRYIVADLHREAQRAAATAAAHLRTAMPDLTFDVDVQQRNPVDLILDHGADAELIVLGTGHRGLVSRVLFGSVSSAVAARAEVPVVVVGDPAPPPDGPGDIVIGVKPDDSAAAVLRFGFEIAARQGRAVRAVLCGTSHGLRSGHQDTSELQRWLSEALAGWCEQYPDVPVTPVVRQDEAAPTLVAEAEDAALLVVGRSGKARHAIGTLGAVSLAVVHHATIPVAVIPVPRDQE